MGGTSLASLAKTAAKTYATTTFGPVGGELAGAVIDEYTS